MFKLASLSEASVCWFYYCKSLMTYSFLSISCLCLWLIWFLSLSHSDLSPSCTSTPSLLTPSMTPSSYDILWSLSSIIAFPLALSVSISASIHSILAFPICLSLSNSLCSLCLCLLSSPMSTSASLSCWVSPRFTSFSYTYSCSNWASLSRVLNKSESLRVIEVSFEFSYSCKEKSWD